MALKQIMLRKKIKAKREALAELETAATSIETRSAELEAAIGEAKTDEEIRAVEDEVDKLEKDKEENDTAKKTLGDEIQELEKELNEVEDKKPKGDPEPSPSSERSALTQTATYQERGARNMPRIFKSMPHQERATLVERSEVKEF